MKIVYAAIAHERIRQLHPLIRQNIRQSIETLVANPYAGKPLENELDGYHSLACLRYRIIYEIKNKTILIQTIGHREDVYEVFSQQVKQIKPKN